MVETKYTFSIAGDTGAGIVNSDSLTTEIGASAIVEPLTRIETLLDDLDIYFANALSGGDVLILNGVVAAHLGTVPENQAALTTGIGRDPLPTDDVAAGYQILDRWYNSSSGETFSCVDNSVGTAVWKRTTALGLATESALTDLTNAINSGIDLADHGARHIQGGGDEIDGDQIDIDFTPSTYTPDISPPEVTDVDHLTAHLAGIDNALGGIGTDDKRVQVSVDDTTPGFLEEKIVAGSNIALATLTPGGNETLEISATGLVPETRQIIAGAGLTGGGDLTADRTLDVVANADGSIVVNANDIQVGILASDLQHGVRGGGILHAEATGLTAGFLSAADKTKLDGIESGAQVNDVDSVFGRTGAVVALASDYDAVQVDFTPDGDIVATDVQAAIVEVRDDTDTKLAGKADVTHAATHIQGGSDEIDGDQIDIDFTPTNYTPNTTPPEVTDVDHLSAHLSGIDTALGSVISDDKTVQVSVDDTTPGFLEDKIAAGSNIVLTTLNPGANEQLEISTTGLVPDTRQIIAGAGLTGGGDLTADRTLDVVANADGSIVVNANDIQVGILATDAQHGNRGGGTLHAVATGLSAGFLSAADKTKLDGIEAGAEVNDVFSVFGRVGAVVAQASDYDAVQVDFTPDGDIIATDVQAAIVEVRDDTDTKLAGKADVTHAATHIQGGSDEVDGDQIDIDFTPSNYTPNITPPEVTDVDHLSAHLAGIDDALGGIGADDKRVRVSADDTTPGFLEDKIVAGSNIALATLSPGGNETLEISATGLVPETRQIIAGAGLTGGGDLTADRTLDVVANADGSIVVNANDIQVGILATDDQHGNRGGGSLHAIATGATAGFLSAADKSKLDGIEAGAEVNDVFSVFGRVGAVVAVASDYDAVQVDFTPDGDIAATDVQAAIVEVRDDTDTKLAGKADVTHAATHIQGGSDEVDGDQVDIDFTPTIYVPDVTPPEVSDADQLSAHLAGIDNALVFGSNFETITSNTLQQTTSGTFQNFITLNTASLPAGTYRIGFVYQWSYNATNNDFLGRIQVDAANIVAGEVHRQEPKDSAGAGPAGTNQRFFFSGFVYQTFGAAGTHTITIDYASGGGAAAAIYYGTIEIWRVS